jgi:hypothetical protein
MRTSTNFAVLNAPPISGLKGFGMRKLSMDELGRKSVEEFKAAKKNMIIAVLDNIRSMHNVGKCDSERQTRFYWKVFVYVAIHHNHRTEIYIRPRWGNRKRLTGYIFQLQKKR